MYRRAELYSQPLVLLALGFMDPPPDILKEPLAQNKPDLDPSLRGRPRKTPQCRAWCLTSQSELNSQINGNWHSVSQRINNEHSSCILDGNSFSIKRGFMVEVRVYICRSLKCSLFGTNQNSVSLCQSQRNTLNWILDTCQGGHDSAALNPEHNKTSFLQLYEQREVRHLAG